MFESLEINSVLNELAGQAAGCSISKSVLSGRTLRVFKSFLRQLDLALEDELGASPRLQVLSSVPVDLDWIGESSVCVALRVFQRNFSLLLPSELVHEIQLDVSKRAFESSLCKFDEEVATKLNFALVSILSSEQISRWLRVYLVNVERGAAKPEHQHLLGLSLEWKGAKFPLCLAFDRGLWLRIEDYARFFAPTLAERQLLRASSISSPFVLEVTQSDFLFALDLKAGQTIWFKADQKKRVCFPKNAISLNVKVSSVENNYLSFDII